MLAPCGLFLVCLPGFPSHNTFLLKYLTFEMLSLTHQRSHMLCTQQQHVYRLESAHLWALPFLCVCLTFHLSWTSSPGTLHYFSSKLVLRRSPLSTVPSPQFFFLHSLKSFANSHYASTTILNIFFFICFCRFVSKQTKTTEELQLSQSVLAPLWLLVYFIFYQDLSVTSFKGTGQMLNSFFSAVLRFAQCTLRWSTIYLYEVPKPFLYSLLLEIYFRLWLERKRNGFFWSVVVFH